jgi:hypothetical protein
MRGGAMDKLRDIELGFDMQGVPFLVSGELTDWNVGTGMVQ